VLALGNLLLGDDGVGLALLERIARYAEWGPAVELVDGGTAGLSLLGQLDGRTGLLVLDAVGLGAAPGTVHVLGLDDVLGMGRRAGTAHEGNASELLQAAMLLGTVPARVVVVGVEPEVLRTGIGLSEPVSAALDAATRTAVRQLERLLLPI
jgi:hydrogenase maturation protease